MADKDKLAKYRTEIQQVSSFHNSVTSSSHFLDSLANSACQRGKECIGFPNLCASCSPILDSLSSSGDDVHMHIFKMRAVTFHPSNLFRF
jgi:hypothetical protein